jgi:hypothetical protein
LLFFFFNLLCRRHVIIIGFYKIKQFVLWYNATIPYMVCKFGYCENQEKRLLTSVFISFGSPNKLWCLLHTKSVVLFCCHYKFVIHNYPFSRYATRSYPPFLGGKPRGARERQQI